MKEETAPDHEDHETPRWKFLVYAVFSFIPLIGLMAAVHFLVRGEKKRAALVALIATFIPVVALTGSATKTPTKSEPAPGASASSVPAEPSATAEAAGPAPTATAVADAAPSASAEAPVDASATTVGGKLDALLAKAIDAKSFESKIMYKDWAFQPVNAVGCGGGERDDGTEFDKRIDQPDTSNEFEMKRLLDSKDEIKKSLLDTIVKLEGSSRIEPKNYDFKKKTFQFRVGNSTGYNEFDRWPFPGGEPKFSRESITIDGKADTGLRIGGKKVEVNTQEEIADYNNVSALPITVTVEPDEAEQWSKSGVELKYVFVQQFKGVGFHKACKYGCTVIFGTRVCSNKNEGKGTFYKTVALGHRIWIDGKVVAESVSEK